VRVFPCAVSLASSMITLVSKTKSPPVTCGKALYLGAQSKILAPNEFKSIDHGPSSADMTKIRRLGGRSVYGQHGRTGSTRQRVKNNCNPHMGP
jgi:hypothetical protein